MARVHERHEGFSTGQAALVLEISVAKLNQCVTRGWINPTLTPGGHRRFAHADVEALRERLTLTPDDVAKRLDAAMLRVLKILMDARQIEGLRGPVRTSRFTTNTGNALAWELLHEWNFEPQALRDTGEPVRKAGWSCPGCGHRTYDPQPMLDNTMTRVCVSCGDEWSEPKGGWPSE